MPADPAITPATEPQTRPARGRWLAILLLILIAAVALVVIGLFATARPIMSFLNALPGIASRFKTGTITQTFTESIPQVTSTHGDVLELATSRSEETFRRTDSKSILWNLVDLGDTVSEIHAPVTFRYHLRLSDPWRLASRNNVCVVLAPPIRPSLPPAIHTDLMEMKTENGWARFNKDDSLAELERSMTPTLERRAANPAHQALAREACRKSVAEFVKNWLLKEDHWRSDRFSSIIVVFPDEGKFESDKDLEKFERGPAVKLQGAHD